jgi:FixJ family two-component response regulator
MVYDGSTNKAIGIQLGISTKTVEKHRGKAMKKMQVLSLASLVRLMDRELGRN